MHHIKITNFGPIRECEMDVNQFTVLTGPQASGKSTIAKAIYFFRTIKDDILDLILKNNYQISLNTQLKANLINKFINLYGNSLKILPNTELRYTYKKGIYIELSVIPDGKYFTFDYGIEIDEFLVGKNNFKHHIDESTKNELYEKLNDLFRDDTETIYVPAGRMAISLLSEQLNYIFMSMDDTQRRTVDYCVRKYFELGLKIRPYFEKISLTNRNIAEFYQKIIKAEYKYENLQERLYFDNDSYIALNFASSGQQEAVWILNILNYFAAENKKIYLIVEEPEAHLYPESQMYMTDALALFVNGGNNSGLITTHSPYILGELNNLILCGQASNKGVYKNSIKKASNIDEKAWFQKDVLQAFHVIGGKCKNALTDGLIMNELIEGASVQIDEKSAGLIALFHGEDA